MWVCHALSFVLLLMDTYLYKESYVPFRNDFSNTEYILFC